MSSYIETKKGMINPLDPSPEQVNAADIAHALSNICRFTGHTRAFYSVAQHSILVAENTAVIGMDYGPNTVYLMALLHDASEAYLCDMAKPVKEQIPDYKAIEARLMEVILYKFRLSTQKLPAIVRADLQVLETERRDLMPGREPPWGPPEMEPLADKIVPWTPWLARRQFTRALRRALVKADRLDIAAELADMPA